MVTRQDRLSANEGVWNVSSVLLSALESLSGA